MSSLNISGITNPQVDNAKDMYVVMLMYNLKEDSNNYLMAKK